MINYYLKALKSYSDFNGRARRSEYWFFFLGNMIIAFLLGFLGGLIKFPMLGGIFWLIVLLPSIAVAVRRMHDIGKPWWYMFIPIYNIILAITEGDKGPNAHGEDPKKEK